MVRARASRPARQRTRGGRAAAAKLAGFLQPMIDRGVDADAQQPSYEAGNEQDLWAPWEADFFGDPALTERATTAAVTHFYQDDPAGLPGNDDAGAMSSWALWAMIGLFPMVPGTTTMAVGSPEFTSVTIHAGARTHDRRAERRLVAHLRRCRPVRRKGASRSAELPTATGQHHPGAADELHTSSRGVQPSCAASSLAPTPFCLL